MDRSVATEERTRGHPGGAICRRHRSGFSGKDGGRAVLERTERANEEVRPGTAPRENAAAGVRSLCGRATAKAGRREAGNSQLLGLYAHLRRVPEWKIYGDTADDP